MAYEIRFIKKVLNGLPIEEYINECCFGGDVILNQLLPELEKKYHNLSSCQEDWGWYLAIKAEEQMMGISIYTEQFDTGDFWLRLESAKKKGWFRYDRSDTPELANLKDHIVQIIDQWTGKPSKVAQSAQ